MDFVKFRQTGELSDVEVELDNKVFKLHRFPLYTKSDYFLAVLGKPKEDGSTAHIKLDNFPGGVDLFSLVADFCYGIRLDITFDNLVPLSCASEFLGMAGQGNLAQKTDYYFESILERAELVPLVRVMVTSAALSEHAKAQEHFNSAADAFCRCVEKSYRGRQQPLGAFTTLGGDFWDAVTKLKELDHSHFLHILENLQRHQVDPKVVSEIVSSYLAMVLHEHRKLDLARSRQESRSSDSEEGSGSGGESTSVETESSSESGSGSGCESKVQQIDTILSAVDDKPALTDCMPDGVITETLAVMLRPDKSGPPPTSESANKAFLVGVAASMLEKLPTRFLISLPSDLVHAIIKTRCDSHQPLTNLQCVEQYVQALAAAGRLSLATFMEFCDLIKPVGKMEDGILLHIIQELLETGTDITEEQQQELLALVSFDQVHESALKAAYESAVIPLPLVTQAALDKCEKLRSEADDAKRLARALEDEIQELRRETGRDGQRPVPTAYSSLVSSARDLTPTPRRYRSLYSRWATDPYRGLW